MDLRMHGSVVAIVGGTSGVGRHVARVMAADSGVTVLGRGAGTEF